MPVVSHAELMRRRTEILEAARSCFAEFGYEGATVRRLEQYTGKSRGAIFHHFGDKESLFLEIARSDAERQANVVARDGLVEVMRDMLHHPERHDWLGTRLEIASIMRTDPTFRSKWQEHQKTLDDAIASRLAANAAHGGIRDDVPLPIIQLFLETIMDGFISRLASGYPTDGLEQVLDVVEGAVRHQSTSH